MALRALLTALLVGSISATGVLPLPQFEIDLDLKPEDRFTHVIEHFREPLEQLYSDLVNNSVVKGLAAKVSQQRGPENPELMGEINGIAAAIGWPVSIVHGAQFLYEIQTLMVPITNVSWPFLTQDESWLLKNMLEQRSVSFGCTGIIARSEVDGTVYHARNLDFSFAKYLQKMAYNGVFTRGGKELYTAQMIAIYQSVITGIRRGSNGYTFELNTRYYGHKGGNELMLKNLFVEKRLTSGWTKRQILQHHSDYEDAVAAMATTPYAATEYNIISGVDKGVILARDPDGLAYHIDLQPTDRYIIMTNFDYIYHDIKEWFDPTGVKGIGHSRRLGAERILNNSKITPELLYEVLNNDAVMAKDSMFQMIANVQTNLYNSSLPPCQSCGRCMMQSQCREKSETCCTSREHFSLKCGLTGAYRCGCLSDGQCLAPRANMTNADADCCSFESHHTLECPGSFRRCGMK